MAQKKAHEVEGWLKRPDARAAIVLVYGPDRGMVSERAKVFATASGLPLDDPFSVVLLDAAEVDRDPGRLVDEARTVPMFAERRLLWLRNAAAQKGLAEAVKALLSEPPREALILIEAGELKKGAPLRTAVEASPSGMALPCYADEARDLDAVIDAELSAAGMSISTEARQVLRSNLGGDRLASRGEIRKLALYAHGSPEITVDDIRALTGDVSGQTADDAIDRVLEGRPDAFDAAFARLHLASGQVSTVLGSAMRQFQMLHAMRGAVEDGRDAGSVVASARPPVFFARRRLIEDALRRLPLVTLTRILARLQAAILESRRRPDLAVAIARQALLAVSLEARRPGR